ncbi:imm11 family protein [Cystobacter fuscus]|uniref:imm11 family protein n=1 Tax=Cystobacter fuscus TaxID=43 RepID=UPI0007C59896|nr:DUF1629 domain-containing protein [Cystobacter fuscus]
MTTRYFWITKDYGTAAGSWQLDEPVDATGEAFDRAFQLTSGMPVSVEDPLKCPLKRPGTPLDFSLTDTSDIPVVPERLARLIAQWAPGDVQAVPVEVKGQTEPHCILVATRTVACIDDAKCKKVEYRKPEVGRPERAGRRYKRVDGLRIDPEKVGAAQLFRPSGWTVALIVSERIHAALLDAEVSGIHFECVTRPPEHDVSEQDPSAP